MLRRWGVVQWCIAGLLRRHSVWSGRADGMLWGPSYRYQYHRPHPPHLLWRSPRCGDGRVLRSQRRLRFANGALLWGAWWGWTCAHDWQNRGAKSLDAMLWRWNYRHKSTALLQWGKANFLGNNEWLLIFVETHWRGLKPNMAWSEWKHFIQILTLITLPGLLFSFHKYFLPLQSYKPTIKLLEVLPDSAIYYDFLNLFPFLPQNDKKTKQNNLKIDYNVAHNWI